MEELPALHLSGMSLRACTAGRNVQIVVGLVILRVVAYQNILDYAVLSDLSPSHVSTVL